MVASASHQRKMTSEAINLLGGVNSFSKTKSLIYKRGKIKIEPNIFAKRNPMLFFFFKKVAFDWYNSQQMVLDSDCPSSHDSGKSNSDFVGFFHLY